MAQDGSAVLATRDMIVYYQPFNAANAFPADTLDYGTAWGGSWVDAGYTDGGLEANISVDRGEITVDQLIDPILRPVTGRNVTFSTDLAQLSVALLSKAAGLGSVTTLAPGAGTKGHDTLSISANVADDYNSWGFEAKQQNGEPFRGLIWKGLATGSPSPNFGQADTKATIALEISALADDSSNPARIAEFRNVLAAV